MKRYILVFLIIITAVSLIPAESVMKGLFEAADQVASDLPEILHGEGDLLLGGLSFNNLQIQLGDLMADLVSNRLAGRNGFTPQLIKNYTSIQYPPSQASWILSGTVYKAGAGYLLVLHIIDNSCAAQLKGWEFALGAEGIENLLQPSVLASAAGAWDRHEPNDISSEASLIELPFNEEGLTLGSGDEDWFSFVVPEAGSGFVMMLEASTGGSMDTYMELYSPDDQGSSVAENDDYDGGNAALQMPLNAAGIWYLKIRSFGMDEEGDYSLRIELTEGVLGPGEPDEGQDLASRLNVGSSPLQKRIDYSEDRDWFKIDLLSSLGMEEVLRVETLSNMDLMMEMTDEYGEYIMDDDDSGQDNNPMIMASDLDAGTYYVTVYGYGGETGSYEIMANVMIPVKDEFEEDNSMISASRISADGTVQRRNFTPMGDTDWVQFEVENEGRYLIKTQGNLDTYIELYNGNGDLVEENDDGDDYNAMIERFLTPGTYYINVYPYGSSGSDDIYELSVEFIR